MCSGFTGSLFIYTIIDGEFSVSCSFDKHLHYENGALIGLPIANLFPSKRTERFLHTVHPKLVKALSAIGVNNGTMSIQCFTDEDRFYVYEAGFRLGGEQSYILQNI